MSMSPHTRSSRSNTTMPPVQSRKLNSLNLDILLHIVDFLKRPDMLSLTRTDRALHRMLVPMLLRGHVNLFWWGLESFRAFMDADSSRVSLLRRLDMETAEASIASHVDALAKAGYGESLRLTMGTIQRCSNLVVLTMRVPAFGGLPPMVVRTTLSCLPRLEELRLVGVTQAYQDVLAGALPNLRSVELAFQWNALIDHKTPWASLDPLSFLHDRTSVIEQLTIKNAYVHGNSSSFPRLRVLDLDGVFIPDGVRTLVRLFPDIEELSTQTLFLSNMAKDYTTLLQPYHHTLRELYRGARDTYMPLPVHERSWPHLRRVTTRDASELLYLGLLCPTGVMEMEMSETTLQEDLLLEVLENLRPKHVSCRADLPLMCHNLDNGMQYIVQQLLRRSVNGAPDTVLRWPQEVLQHRNLTSLVSKAAFALTSPKCPISSLLIQLTRPLRPSRDIQECICEAHEIAEQHMRALMDPERCPTLRHIAIDVESRGLRAWELRRGEWLELDASHGREVWRQKIPTAFSFALVLNPYTAHLTYRLT